VLVCFDSLREELDATDGNDLVLLAVVLSSSFSVAKLLVAKLLVVLTSQSFSVTFSRSFLSCFAWMLPLDLYFALPKVFM
jgi:hypothetical protein